MSYIKRYKTRNCIRAWIDSKTKTGVYKEPGDWGTTSHKRYCTAVSKYNRKKFWWNTRVDPNWATHSNTCITITKLIVVILGGVIGAICVKLMM